jgi:cell division septum initiation protein DivIVA
MWSAAPGALPAPEFKTVRRGFEQSQVNEYIGQMNDRLKTVENLVRQLRSETEQAQAQRDTAVREREVVVQQRNDALRERDAARQERASADAQTYEQVSGRVTGLLVALDRDVEKIRAEAEAEAEQIVARARSEAYRVQHEAEEARTTSAQASRQAREDAERSLAELTSQRESMLGELRRTCGTFLEVIRTLAASIDGGAIEAVQQEASDGTAAAPATAREEQPDRTVVLPDVMPDRPA